MADVETFPNLKSVAEFFPSLRAELFYSLLVLTDPESRIHKEWKRKSAQALGSEFFKRFDRVGGGWLLWPSISTLAPVDNYQGSFEDIIVELKKVPARDWQEKILFAAFHNRDLVDSILQMNRPLKSAINKAPKKKQEWLGFVGLYPYDPNNPLMRSLEVLITDPERFKKEVLKLLHVYWQKVFQKTWAFYLPALKRSVAQKELLFASCSFEEFARAALLRVEIDSEKNMIKAVRGGYQLKDEQIRKCVFAPSAFNDKRLWSALKSSNAKSEDVMFFPYFDPSIQLDLSLAAETQRILRPEADPLLVFKALGDTTRYAIASLLARSPQTATELFQILEVSKPTISHHLEIMRTAGLLEEEPIAGSVRLRLNRTTLEELSERVMYKLFESDGKLDLSRTRQKGGK